MQKTPKMSKNAKNTKKRQKTPKNAEKRQKNAKKRLKTPKTRQNTTFQKNDEFQIFRDQIQCFFVKQHFL